MPRLLHGGRNNEPVEDSLEDCLRNLVLGACRVDDDTARRFRHCDREERPAQGLMKRQILAFEAIRGFAGGAPGRGAGKPFDDREVENQGQVGPHISQGDSFERPEEAWIHLSARALIGPGRIRVAIGHNPCSSRKGGRDGGVDMVNSGGGEKDRLGGRTEGGNAARKKQFAQNFGTRRTSWLACGDCCHSRLPEVTQQMTDLSRFASPFATLESNKESASGRGSGRHTRLPYRFKIYL